jgi:hypothetical protein
MPSWVWQQPYKSVNPVLGPQHSRHSLTSELVAGRSRAPTSPFCSLASQKWPSKRSSFFTCSCCSSSTSLNRAGGYGAATSFSLQTCERLEVVMHVARLASVKHNCLRASLRIPYSLQMPDYSGHLSGRGQNLHSMWHHCAALGCDIPRHSMHHAIALYSDGAPWGAGAATLQCMCALPIWAQTKRMHVHMSKSITDVLQQSSA